MGCGFGDQVRVALDPEGFQFGEQRGERLALRGRQGVEHPFAIRLRHRVKQQRGMACATGFGGVDAREQCA
ncbi:hypothetical protein D3C86_2169920 [compost metagenome]